MPRQILPPRARCVQITEGTVTCQCPWFNSPTLPLDQLICVACGHGIHTHVDYESKVIYHNPTTQLWHMPKRRINRRLVPAPFNFSTMNPSPDPFASSPTDSQTPSNANPSKSSGDTGTLTAVPVPFQSNSVPHFSQNEADTFVLISNRTTHTCGSTLSFTTHPRVTMITKVIQLGQVVEYP
ncbi:uncharacterized protein BT62DRAFT_1070528 [Guyanagaster necrorhizus]|uniref:Uncharacterized protein n=1 Tax=Guyanagaster necrorhizus TaxID=856835 RepID=A0A9P8AYE4_9AGAR|nr:uncharacterized protein BT62DRAFT_1070528 [Guyanagaster necrorhizus MCA 3950]KAG7452809.1 hypothetical protein BT62DRAFT_1070528 [Guyanagaster necrorhizus MCA 3950]